jgi:hypothetical protein
MMRKLPEVSMRKQSTKQFLTVILVMTSWLAQQQAWAQASSAQPTPSGTATPGNQQLNIPASQTPATGQQQAPASGTTVNPSQPPLQPITTYPDASGAEQARPEAATPEQAAAPSAPQPKVQTSEPQGAATAERVPAAGGAAAKPTGMAIAPAKQHRTRSLLIKIGAIAAAGVAAGAVYALSRGTPSNPPGSNQPGAVQK